MISSMIKARNKTLFFTLFLPIIIFFTTTDLATSVFSYKGHEPSVPVAALPGESYIIYTVVKGDSLWLIANKHNTTVAEIKAANNLTSDTIYPGQVLNIPVVEPDPGIKYINYVVKAGDTLYELAEYFGTSIENIKIVNRLSGDTIYVNQTLRVPASCVSYVIRSGDFLWKIAKNFNTSVEKIKLFNGLKGDIIYAGEILYVPALPQETTVSYIIHTVEQGETIWSISIDYGVPQAEVLNLNGLSESSMLQVGQKIKIPVYAIPVKPTPGPEYGEYLDWWTEAQYLFPIGKTARVMDFSTGKYFNVKRSIGANHADCEPLTAEDASIIKSLWGGSYSWVTRPVIVEVDNRRIAASMSSMPHGIEYLENNNFAGHFDIHFRNSTRHSDGKVDPSHQEKIKIAAGIK